ncbi:MAG: hypothetical protein WCK03_02380 [Candidatus Taylorbacteria bacterium]
MDAFCCSGRYDALDPYAQPKTVQTIVSTPRPPQLVDTFQKFEVNGVLHARKEEIGVLCADQTLMGTPAILTDDTYDLVMSFKGKRFDIDEVSAFAGISKDDAVTLCSALVRDKVFVPIS